MKEGYIRDFSFKTDKRENVPFEGKKKKEEAPNGHFTRGPPDHLLLLPPFSPVMASSSSLGVSSANSRFAVNSSHFALLSHSPSPSHSLSPCNRSLSSLINGSHLKSMSMVAQRQPRTNGEGSKDNEIGVGQLPSSPTAAIG